MAKRSSSATPKRLRSHTLPVRVVRDSAPPPPPVPEPEPERPSRPGRLSSDAPVAVDVATRTRVVWLATIGVLLIIFIGWFATVGANLTKPGRADSLWLKIKANIRSALSLQAKPDSPQSPAEQEFNALDQRLFPNVR